ncbi:hypothetical protein BC941DRAFT_408578, partial [Chlamydoabsidia padenii]
MKHRLILFIIILFITIAETANCFCKKIPKLFTSDCCHGCHGEISNEGDQLTCHFDDYSYMADFNRCCDSYFGMARCTL